MKNADTNADDAQEVDIGDVEVSAEPSVPRRTAPPPLPPSASVPPHAPPAAAYVSQAPSVAPPAPPARSPMFFVGIIFGVLVLAVGAGFVVSRARQAPPTVGAAPSASAAPKVITIPVVDMDDVPDAGP